MRPSLHCLQQHHVPFVRNVLAAPVEYFPSFFPMWIQPFRPFALFCLFSSEMYVHTTHPDKRRTGVESSAMPSALVRP
jgi:hypothetical protein